jgi:hypothetical protein
VAAVRAKAVQVVAPLIDQVTFADSNARRRSPKNFHASSIDDCGRKQWYGVRGYPQAEETEEHPEWKRSATAGDALHEIWQDMLLRTGLIPKTDEFFRHIGVSREQYPESQRKTLPEYAIELPLPPNEYLTSGRIDAVVKINGEYWYLDIKTVDQKKFDDGASSWKFKKYKAQLQVYMHLTGIRKSLILLVNRNDLTQREYLIEYDAEWCEKQFGKAGRITKLKIFVDLNILPPAEPDKFACNFCPFVMICAMDFQRKDD